MQRSTLPDDCSLVRERRLPVPGRFPAPAAHAMPSGTPCHPGGVTVLARCAFCGKMIEAQLDACTIWSRYTRRYRRVYRPSVVVCTACAERVYRTLHECVQVECEEGCQVGK